MHDFIKETAEDLGLTVQLKMNDDGAWFCRIKAPLGTMFEGPAPTGDESEALAGAFRVIWLGGQGPAQIADSSGVNPTHGTAAYQIARHCRRRAEAAAGYSALRKIDFAVAMAEPLADVAPLEVRMAEERAALDLKSRMTAETKRRRKRTPASNGQNAASREWVRRGF